MKQFKVTMSDGTEKMILAENEEDAKLRAKLRANLRAESRNSKEILDLLIKACEAGHMGVIKTLIKTVNIDTISSSGKTPLNVAVRKGDIDVVKLLLKAGFDINEQDQDCSGGYTPLILASHYGYINIIKLLIDNGANVNVKDYDDMTALKYAIKRGNINAVLLLLKSGADTGSIRLKDLSEEMKKAFISAGININDVSVKIINLANEILAAQREEAEAWERDAEQSRSTLGLSDLGVDEDQWDDKVWEMANKLGNMYGDYMLEVDKFDWKKEARKIAKEYIDNGYDKDDN